MGPESPGLDVFTGFAFPEISSATLTGTTCRPSIPSKSSALQV
jgi:hypothetical protein